MAFNINYNEFDFERILKEDEFITSKLSDIRSPFERDRARIIHSSAFRRLQGKTQIMSPGYFDFYRTRLTHSLEVSQISKGIGLKFGLDTTLLETVALAHDIGHPPLGHSGEKTLMELMKEHGLFESNAQNIRILTYLEIKALKEGKSFGLNLTRATLDGIIKYKCFLSKENKKGIYEESKEELLFIDPYYENGQTPIESQIMDWADDIAYSVHDIEDGIRLSLINSIVMEKIEDSIVEDACEKGIEKEFTKRILEDFKIKLYEIQKANPFERKRLIKHFTSFKIHKFINAASLVENPKKRPDTQRYDFWLLIDKESKWEVFILKTISKELFISDYRLEQLRHKLSFIIRELFEVFAQKDAKKYYPDDFKYIWDLTDCEHDEKKRFRLACDYISGMTDNFALKLYKRLFSPTNDGLFDIVKKIYPAFTFNKFIFYKFGY